jgi:hypothetical protein
VTDNDSVLNAEVDYETLCSGDGVYRSVSLRSCVRKPTTHAWSYVTGRHPPWAVLPYAHPCNTARADCSHARQCWWEHCHIVLVPVEGGCDGYLHEVCVYERRCAPSSPSSLSWPLKLSRSRYMSRRARGSTSRRRLAEATYDDHALSSMRVRAAAVVHTATYAFRSLPHRWITRDHDVLPLGSLRLHA